MKIKLFNLVSAITLLGVTIGCTSAPVLPSTPVPPTEASRTSPLTEPTSASMPDTWTDDFNGALAAGWNWANEDSTRWSLKDTPGALRILTQSESLYRAGKPKNLLLRDASAGDFEIITKVTFDPHDNFQQAAILIYQDEGNFVLLNRGFCGVRGCPGSGIFLDNVINRQLDHANSPRKDSSLQTTWLKLRKDGIQYIGFYSADGQTWDELGRVENPMTSTKVGLTANSSHADPYARQISADFDSFTVQRITFDE